MSHTTTIRNVLITDVSALRAAVAELKQQGVQCDLLENMIPRGYYDSQAGLEKAPLVLRLPDSRYDVGFYETEQKEGFEARTDFFGGDVQKILGVTPGENDDREQAKMGKLYHLYAIHAATQAAVRQGHAVNRVNNADGSVQLQVQVA